MNRPIEGSLAMVPALESLRGTAPIKGAGELYQSSLMSALFEGLYDGEVTYASLREHGDFGLGTFNELDGEMVAFDGNFYQLRSDGTARPVDANQKTPFAVMTFFQSSIEREIAATTTKSDVESLITSLTSQNLFYAVRLDGMFTSVITRTVRRQQKPYPPLSEAASHQKTNDFHHVKGTLAGFRSPSYAQGVGVAGFHFHFLRDDRLAGGHALDYVLANGHLAIAPQHSLHVELPQSPEFKSANLEDPSLRTGIRDAEG